jgi:hypothetical protein
MVERHYVEGDQHFVLGELNVRHFLDEFLCVLDELCFLECQGSDFSEGYF